MEYSQGRGEALKDGTGGSALRDTRLKLEELKVQQQKAQQAIVRHGHQVHATGIARYMQGGEQWNQMDGSGVEGMNDVLAVEMLASPRRSAGSFTIQGGSAQQHTFEPLYLHSSDDEDEKEWGENGKSLLVKSRDTEALARRIEREMAQRQAQAQAQAPTVSRRRTSILALSASGPGPAPMATARRKSLDMPCADDGQTGNKLRGPFSSQPQPPVRTQAGSSQEPQARRTGSAAQYTFDSPSNSYLQQLGSPDAGSSMAADASTSPPIARFGRRSSALCTSYDSLPAFGPVAAASGSGCGGSAAAGAASMNPLLAHHLGQRQAPTKHASLQNLPTHGASPVAPAPSSHLSHLQRTHAHSLPGPAGGPESSSAPHSVASSAAGSSAGSPLSRASTNPESITNMLRELSEEHSVGLLSTEQSKQSTYGRAGARKAPSKAISRLCLATGPQAATGQSNNSGLAPVAMSQLKGQDSAQSAAQPLLLPPPPTVVPLDQIMQSAANRYDPHRDPAEFELHPPSPSATSGADSRAPARRRRASTLAMNLASPPSNMQASVAAVIERSGGSFSSLGSGVSGEAPLKPRGRRASMAADLVERAGARDSLDQWVLSSS